LPRTVQRDQVINKWDGSDGKEPIFDTRTHRIPRGRKPNELAAGTEQATVFRTQALPQQ
jgi:hypothetical protein